MIQNRIEIQHIPAIVWGNASDKVWLCVHGKQSSKEAFEELASIAWEKGWQTLSFDLPQHGQRANSSERCDIWNGMRDLAIIGDHAFQQWQRVSLYACSLGAYFSLQTYPDRPFEKCLFQSPIVDMHYLIRQMMRWFSITEERLAQEKEISTPVDLMTWKYYQYVLKHPIEKWNIPTQILFGGRDQLQSLPVIRAFAQRFACSVTVAENSDHPFMEEADSAIVREWLQKNL